jgi:hypothetical protein
MPGFANAKNLDGTSPLSADAALGGDFARVLARGLEAFWRAMLDDPERLGDLAERLRPLVADKPGEPDEANATAEDLAAVVEALVLTEARVGRLEARLSALTEVASDLVRRLEHLERTALGRVAPPEGLDDGGLAP